MEERFEYAAFISYRHLPQDKEVAKKVQRAIEGFKLPKGLSAERPVSSATGRSLGRCFRDEDELAASHSLPERITDALARSRTLIVICTPDTAGSLWVQREIAEFIRLHGPEHVIAVLARGSSSESIPDILSSQEAIQVDGQTIHVASSPLAADLRPESAHAASAEMLRVIAAVAGCSYDDLVQRQRKRRRARTFAAAICSCALCAIIAALVIWGLTPSGEQLAAESNERAAAALQQLSEGHRMQAIQTALDALPTSASDSSRPVTEEAVAALEASVQMDPDPGNLWRPSFALAVPGNVVSFASSTQDSWVSVLDDTGSVSVFSLRTGAFRFSVSLADFTASGDPFEGLDGEQPLSDQWLMLAAASDSLIIANRSGAGSLVCLDAKSGEVKWEHEKVTASSAALSEDGTRVVVFSIFEKTSLLVGLIDAETGETVDWGEYDDPGLLEWPLFLPSYLDADAQKAYLGTGGYLLWVDFAAGTMDGMHLNDYMARSLEGQEGTVVAASSYRSDDQGRNAPFSISALNQDEPLWQTEGTFDFGIVGPPMQTVAVEGAPRVVGFMNMGGPAVAVTAGNLIQVLREADGSLLYEKHFSNTIAGTGTSWGGDDGTVIAIATADGKLDFWIPFNGTENGTSTITSLPCPIDDASFQWYEGHYPLFLLKSAMPSKEILVYRWDWRMPDETVDASLDELITEAHEILAANQDPASDSDLAHVPYPKSE